MVNKVRFFGRQLIGLPMRSCRFEPTCSCYAQKAVERYGILKGGWLAVLRISRCHPWSRGGFDPVPEKRD